jgi:hypothetical protein
VNIRAVFLLSWSVIPLGAAFPTRQHVLSFPPSHVMADASTGTPDQPYPTPLPAEIFINKVTLFHIVYHRWTPTTTIHLTERVRFVVIWSTDAGKLWTRAAASLTVSRKGRRVYEAFREDPSIRSNGSFQWTVRFRVPQTVGRLRADVSVRSNNTSESSLAFTLTAPHSGNRYTLLIDGRPMSAVTNSEVAPLGKSPALFVVNARMAVRCFTMTSLAL